MDPVLPIAATVLGLGWVLGGVLTVLGRRGRRINDHPCCRRCGYDLVGGISLPERCPECGAVLGASGVRDGVRERRPRMMWCGLTLTAISAMASVTAVGLGYSGTGWFPYAPPIALRIVLGTTKDAERRDAVADEIFRRIANTPATTTAEADALADVVLAAQRDRTKPWTAAWQAAFDAAVDQAAVSDGRATELIASAVRFRLSLRDPTGKNSPVRFTYHITFDYGSRTGAMYHTERFRSTLISADPPVVLADHRRDDRRTIDSIGGPSSEEEVGRFPVGKHTFRFQLDGVVTRGPRSVKVRTDQTLTTEVVPYDIPDPPLPPGMRLDRLGG